jgi:hypothetical protein
MLPILPLPPLVTENAVLSSLELAEGPACQWPVMMHWCHVHLQDFDCHQKLNTKIFHVVLQWWSQWLFARWTWHAVL